LQSFDTFMNVCNIGHLQHLLTSKIAKRIPLKCSAILRNWRSGRKR
jgi:hypothetical protein